MLVLGVLVAVLAVAAAVLAVLLVRARAALAAERRTGADLQVRVADAEASRAASSERAERAEAQVAVLAAEAAAATKERAGLEKAIAAADVARAEAEGGAAALEAALAVARAGGGDPGVLWALELVRTARRWREDVAPGPHAESPLTDAPDPLQVAVGIEAAAVKEATGTTVDVDWQLDSPLGPPPALVVLRAVQEVLAAGAKAVDSGRLVVAAEGDDVVVSLIGAPDEPVTPPDPLAGAGRAAVAATGAVDVRTGPGRVEARLRGVLAAASAPAADG